MTKALRLFFAVFVAAAIAGGVLIRPVRAASPVLSNAFNTQSVGEAVRLTLTTQLLCQVTLNQQAPGTIITPQESSNGGITWKSINTIGNGAISQTGVFIGPVDAGNYPLIRLWVTQLNGSISGNIVCGDTIPVPLYGGQSGGAVNQIVPGICTSPNPPIGNVAVDYVCNTPQPIVSGLCTSPRPTGVNGIAIDVTCQIGQTPAPGNCLAYSTPPVQGTISYTCPTPYPTPVISVTTTPCNGSNLPSVSGFALTIPAPCASGGGSSATANPFEPALAARTDIMHLYTLHIASGGTGPSPCPTTAGFFTDTPESAAPSPVPATAVIESTLGAPTCAWPDILHNNTSPIGGTAGSVSFCWGVAQQGCNVAAGGGASFVQLPAAAQTACFASTPYTIFGLVYAQPTTRTQTFYSQNWAAQNVLQGQINTTAQYNTLINNVAHAVLSVTTPAFWVFTNNGTTATTYVNGFPVSEPTTLPSPAPSGVGSLGESAAGTNGFLGSLEDWGCANTAWSQSTIQYLYSLTGL